MNGLTYFHKLHGPHQKHIRQHFKDATSFQGTAPIFDMPLTLVCFTNRCGSTLLAEYLRLTRNFAGLHEQLNHDVVCNTAARLGVSRFPDYVAALTENASEQAKSFGFKASWDQLLMLLRWNIPAMFTGLNIIHIEREDLVAQAVSFSIADQTKKWNSNIKGGDKEPVYDFDDILNRLNGTGFGNKMIRQICSVHDLNYSYVVYEELIADPVTTLAQLHAQLGMALTQFNLGAGKLRKQAGFLNKEFAARFRQDFIGRL